MASSNVPLSSGARALLLILAATIAMAQLAVGQEIGPFDCRICDGNTCDFYYFKGPRNCVAPAKFFCDKLPPKDKDGKDTPPDKDINCACKMNCVPSVDGVSGNFFCTCPTKVAGERHRKKVLESGEELVISCI